MLKCKAASVKAIFLYFLLFIILSSCGHYKQIPYFMDFPANQSKTVITTPNFKNPEIRADDLLSITIETTDPSVSNLLNSPNNVAQTTDAQVSLNQQTIPGYLVDKNGDIFLPFAGKLKVDGLTTVEARDSIVAEMSLYVKNPIVSVKFANFRISLIGEFNRPAVYIIPTERISILNAIATGGDLTIYGVRRDILLIRDTADNKKIMVHLNIQSKDIMNSPYFYLQPNDVLYAHPDRSKVALTDAAQTRIISLTASIFSVLFVVVDRIALHN